MTTKSKEFYIPMKIFKWDVEVEKDGVKVKGKFERKFGDFFIHVYESREECEKNHPNCAVMKLSE